MGSSHLVCHIIDANVDGSLFRGIAEHHDRARFPVMIGSFSPEGALQASMRSLGVPTFALNAPTRRQYPQGLFRLVQLIRQSGVSIVHAHCFDPTALAIAAARIARVRVVFTRHHSDHNIRIGARWHTAVDAICAKQADHVIAVSEATKQIMMEVEGVPASQITVAYNGMPPMRPADPAAAEGVRRELSLGSRPICLMVARLHEEKGHRFLFDAVQRIRAELGPIDVLLAGEGPHRREIEEAIAARDLGDSVRILGRRNDIPELISLADLVVLPSLAESFGFAILEALAMGKPVVGSTTGGIPEVVGDAGLLVPPADAPALAEAMLGILRDRERAHAMAERGRARLDVFSVEKMMSGYEAVYERVLREK
ncbi:MAG: glycosyltransferase family 4 protein [Polyangiales bacterium]